MRNWASRRKMGGASPALSSSGAWTTRSDDVTVEGSVATLAKSAASTRGETWVDATSVASGVSEVLTSEWIFADPPQHGIEAIMRTDIRDNGQQVLAQTGGIVATISTIAIANIPNRRTGGKLLLEGSDLTEPRTSAGSSAIPSGGASDERHVPET